MIITYAIGAVSRLIHIKYLDVDDAHYINVYCYSPGPLPPLGFHQSICEADKSEDAAYAEAKSNNQDTYVGLRALNAVERSLIRHGNCSCTVSHELSAHTKLLELVPFAICRQLYQLANSILYARKTFSFDDALSLRHFLARLDPNQKKMIRSLHLSRPSSRLCMFPSAKKAWMKALEPSSIRSLEGLRTVHLCVDMNMPLPRYPWDSDIPDYDERLSSDLEPFLQLRVLPLTKVTVVINDDAMPLVLHNVFRSCPEIAIRKSAARVWSMMRWTNIKKSEWAERTRLKLLEPYTEDLVSRVEGMKLEGI